MLVIDFLQETILINRNVSGNISTLCLFDKVLYLHIFEYNLFPNRRVTIALL